MAIKASGAYKNCKPCSGSSDRNNGRDYADSEAGSVSGRYHFSYRRTGSSNSNPGHWGREAEARLKALSSGETTPASVSGRTESVVLTEEDEPKEWVAQVEPGVLITFVSLPDGGNDLKRIRFRYCNHCWWYNFSFLFFSFLFGSVVVKVAICLRVMHTCGDNDTNCVGGIQFCLDFWFGGLF